MADNNAAQGAAQIPAIVFMISGCMDSQTSADVSNVAGFSLPDNAGPGGAGGACTTSLVATMESPDRPNPISWMELLNSMRKILHEKRYTQIPQLSTSRQINLGQDFDVLQGPAEDSKALFVGINYVGQQGELRGCHNDVHMMMIQVERWGFPRENFRILLDDGNHDEPTRQNILDAMDWLHEGASAGCARFMHYSGHGGSVPDESGDEKDGKDECLIPVDYQSAGMILDDLILEKLAMAMPKDTHLVCLMDCCHSGSIFDLPYMCKMDDQTGEMVEAGEVPEMTPNPRFNLQKAMEIAQLFFKEYQNMDKDGGGFAVCCMRSVMKAIKG